MGEKESISGMGWVRMFGAYEVLPEIVGLGGWGVARWSKIEARASPGKPQANNPRQANGSHASQGLPQAYHQSTHTPTSEIMSDELLSNYSN